MEGLTEQMQEKVKEIEKFSDVFFENQSKEETLIIIYSDGEKTYQKFNSTKRNLPLVVAQWLANNPELMNDMNNLIEEME